MKWTQLSLSMGVKPFHTNEMKLVGWKPEKRRVNCKFRVGFELRSF